MKLWQFSFLGKFVRGNIEVEVKFCAANEDPNWNEGIKSANYPGVPNTFFPQREGCMVTLYQDAHVSDEFVNEITNSSLGNFHESKRCWEDIYNAIDKAEQLVFIAGWSIDTRITLIRNDECKTQTLGKLLERKANDGVKVLMLVWDNISQYFPTHDKETQEFFDAEPIGEKKVHCALCPYFADEDDPCSSKKKISEHVNKIVGLFWELDVNEVKNYVWKNLIFSHHQKIVIVDSVSSDGASTNSDPSSKRLVSFIGGLDLCDGRYDTESHPLFRTPETDFYNPSLEDASIETGGPRQPWHDIHCKLEGPAVLDVLSNFEQRWGKQGISIKGDEAKNISRHDSRLDKNTKNDIIAKDKTWNVQVFRSITSAVANLNVSEELSEKIRLKNYSIDKSIQDAYIHAIRRAKRFIYIESQYFIGSSHYWRNTHHKCNGELVEALNLIPKELSLKIVSKIAKD